MSRGGVSQGLAVGCLWLALAAVPAMAELPPGVGSPPSKPDREKLSHLLASGMAAAWNARAAADASQAPTVVIGDDWGNGKPPNLFTGKKYLDAKIVGGKIDNPPSGAGSDHGYHVTGIIFGSFAGDRTNPGLVTGAFPKRGSLFPVDRYEDASLVNDTQKFGPTIAGIPGHVVVNTSIGYSDCVMSIAGEEAVEWIEKVRALQLEDRVFHATAAGNEGQQGGSALCGSDYSAAATRQDLQDTQGTHVDPLINTLSVENIEEASGSAALGCLTPTSNTDGSIAAPGKEVWSFNKSGNAVNKNGTSMSSPLVAGVATYLWSIAPDLTAGQLSAAITLNADAPEVCQRTSAPRMNAYAATLSLDGTGTPTPATWPVRFAILDKNGDGKFDHKDLAAFAPKVKESLLQTKRDWSRFDLNGDGYTGGVDRAPFDLNRTGSARAGNTVLDDPVTDGNGAEYDEDRVTDAEVLCFYAYSPLYTGSTSRRTQELKKLCKVTVKVRFRGGFVELDARCDGVVDEEHPPDDWLSFSETVTTTCANANQTTTIVASPTAISITATGASSADAGTGSLESGTSDLVLDFDTETSVPWTSSGSIASSAGNLDGGSQATFVFGGFGGGQGLELVDARNCSSPGLHYDCDGQLSDPPQTSLSGSGTLPKGQYHLEARSHSTTFQDTGNTASWNFQLDIG